MVPMNIAWGGAGLLVAFSSTTLAVAVPAMLDRRAEYGTNIMMYEPLWGDDGPSCGDIKQHDLNDCFLAATLCILAERGQKWLESAVKISKVYDIEDQNNGKNPPVEEASFHWFKGQKEVYVPDQGSGSTWFYPQQHGVDKWIKLDYSTVVRGRDSDTNFKRDFWWVAGFTTSAEVLQGSDWLDGGKAGQVLNMLTNRDVITLVAADKDTYWEIFQKSAGSCVLLGTSDITHKLVQTHAYAVMSSRVDDGVKKVTLRNPWGPTTEYQLDDIFPDIDHVDHFKNWDTLSPPANLTTTPPATITVAHDDSTDRPPVPGPGPHLD